MGLEECAGALEASGDYRVLRRIEEVEVDPFAGEMDWPVVTLVDVETTGWNAAEEAVVELALLSFRYDPASGAVSAPLLEASWLTDPGRPIPPEATAIHGIGDADVAGRTVDRAAASRIVATSDLLASHSAAFDRPFVDRLGIGSEDKRWACSLRDVSWKTRGFDGSSLHPLAAQLGLFGDRHRGVSDCRMLHALLSRNRDADESRGRRMVGVMDDVHAAATRIDVELFAADAPYGHKDALRARGYRWNDGADGRPKAWFKVLGEHEVEAEEEYVRSHFVRGSRELPRRRVSAVERFRGLAA